MYCCTRPDLSCRVQPLARTTMRTFFASVVEAKSSVEKRWVHRSQWGSIPRKPSQTAAKMAACAMELGLKLCSSTPVVVRERPHEAARWHSKRPLMEGDKANHVPRRRSWVGLARDHPLRLRPTGEGTEQTIGDKGLQIPHDDGGGRPRVTRRNDGHLVSHRRTKVVEAEGMRCMVLFSPAILLGCGNQSRRRAQMAG